MKTTSSFLGLSEYDWSSVTGRQFNIVKDNPKKKQKLGVGESESVLDKYPPLSSVLRNKLHRWFNEQNQHLKDYDFGRDFMLVWDTL